jgi:hypothetical protein
VDFQDKLLSAMRFEFGGHQVHLSGTKAKAWERIAISGQRLPRVGQDG